MHEKRILISDEMCRMIQDEYKAYKASGGKELYAAFFGKLVEERMLARA